MAVCSWGWQCHCTVGFGILLYGIIDSLRFILKCALYIVSIRCICFYCAIAKTLSGLWTVLNNIHWIFCGRYWAISIEYYVVNIEQYPLNILLSILSNIHWIFCEKYWVIHFEYSADSIEQYPSNILWTVLCNVYCMLAVLRYAH